MQPKHSSYPKAALDNRGFYRLESESVFAKDFVASDGGARVAAVHDGVMRKRGYTFAFLLSRYKRALREVPFSELRIGSHRS